MGFLDDCVWDSRQPLEASPAAAEERVADRLARAAILTGTGDTCRYLRLAVGASELGTTAAWKPWQAGQKGDNQTGLFFTQCSQETFLTKWKFQLFLQSNKEDYLCFAWFETNWNFRFERIHLKLSDPPTTHRLAFPLLFWCVCTLTPLPVSGDSLRLHGIRVLSPGNLCLFVLESSNA